MTTARDVGFVDMRIAKGFPLGYLAVYELACYATRRMVELPNTPATLVMVRPD
jgi:hypothetical protein